MPDEQSFAAMVLQDAYHREISDKDKALLLQAKRNIATSDLAIGKRKPLLGFIKLVKDGKGGRYAMNRAQGVVNDYLQGRISDERLGFEREFLTAWCSGKIQDFIKEETARIKVSSDDEKRKLDRMFQLAATRDESLLAVAVSNLWIYHPPQKPEERVMALDNMIGILEAAEPV